MPHATPCFYRTENLRQNPWFVTHYPRPRLVNKHGGSCSHVAAQHTDVESFDCRNSSVLATQHNCAPRFARELELGGNHDRLNQTVQAAKAFLRNDGSQSQLRQGGCTAYGTLSTDVYQEFSTLAL